MWGYLGHLTAITLLGGGAVETPHIKSVHIISERNVFLYCLLSTRDRSSPSCAFDIKMAVRSDRESEDISSAEKTVLVCMFNRNRPVTFCGGLTELQRSAIEVFRDVVTPEIVSDLVFQYRCEEWGGLFLDVLNIDQVQDKAVLKAVISKAVSCLICVCTQKDIL